MSTLSRLKTNQFLLLAFCLLLCLPSCKKGDAYEAAVLPDGIGDYVYAYTSGVISKADPVRVRFNAAVVGDDKVGKAADKKLLNISPQAKGSLTWEDDRTLLFTPDTYFKVAQQYKGMVKLTSLFNNLPKEAASFEFNFRTREQFMDVQVDGISAVSVDDMENQTIIGSVYLSDVESAENLDGILSARQTGGKLPVSWSKGAIPNEYKFTVADVKRSSAPSSVELKWTGKPLGVTAKGNKEVEVPAIGDFKIVNARLVTRGEQQIIVTFSDPIMSNQSLGGMFGISGEDSPPKYVVDGNQVRLYPASRLVGTKTLTAFDGIKNVAGQAMADRSVWTFEFSDVMPEVKLVGRGVIMPESEGLIFPFEAVNLNAVEVEVFKIYENNLLQFLQTNDLDGNYQLERVGRVIHREKVSLGALNPEADKSQMSRYALDLKKLIQSEPGAIYQVRLGFLPGYSDYYCPADDKEGNDGLTMMASQYDDNGEIKSIMNSYYGPNGYYSGYYNDRTNPCKPGYYHSDRFVRRNVFASNLGLVAKKGKDGSFFVAVSDLRNTDAVPNATVKAYDYQQQVITFTKTDSEGVARLNTGKEPYFIVVENGEERGYLKVRDGRSLSMSRFDVGGSVTQKGIKGYIYGERGVWRPGDKLYLNFVLEDKGNRLPQNHPVTMEIYDPRNQLQERITVTDHVGGIYSFTTQTSANSPTGNWYAKVQVGGATFRENLKIETVKPNRLKINLDFGKEEIESVDKTIQGDLHATWLHGAPAGSLKAKVEMQLSSQKTAFDSRKDYVFDDPARSFSSDKMTLFEDVLNSDGKAKIMANVNANNAAPGKLRANFKTRVFEKGGDFSVDNFSMTWSPYSHYTGINLPRNKYGEKRLDMKKEYKIDVAAVDGKGKGAKRKLTAGLYRLDWRWWWDSDYDSYTSYNSGTHHGAKAKYEEVTSDRGDGTIAVQVDDWGRYLLRICDEESGHCTGDIFYAGYPWNEDGEGNKAATMLMFSSDKEEYAVGDNVELSIPASEVSRGLLTIENGTQVLESKWFNLKKGENKIKVRTKDTWTPNVYAHVSLTQPHAQSLNDLPIRMYGVVPLKVVDPKTVLKPVITMAEKIRPEEEFTVEVKETNGKPMAYTIAVVDEGLLDLTRFDTPDPWNTFYAREALGVTTWDMYDQVLGGYGGDLERILSVGGGAIQKKKEGNQAQRFKPVVMHLGPFFLERGRKGKHSIKMPNYVGSVRTMVVAAHDGAYGNAEKTVPVKKPLMALATLPRVLGPNEELQLPVNIFAMEKSVKNVSVSVETGDLIDIVGDKSKNISFSKPGDQIVNFGLKVKGSVGVTKVKVTAKSGSEVATHEIEIEVRNPNPFVTNVYEKILEAGESWKHAYSSLGMDGTNEGILEVSNIPPINLGERLRYLIQYPHGCIEQTTSSGFPQLYVDKLMELDERQKEEVPKNVQATIDRLKNFQVDAGGFGYWPGDDYASQWGTNYAGHFILEAKKLGYVVPDNMLSKWKKFQAKAAKRWDPNLDRWDGDLNQAYRLYTLALAGSPELGAMNRLRNMKKLTPQAKWRLAAAYALSGKKSVATQLISALETKVEDYRELGYTYGSGLRDQAMILETLVALKDRKEAAKLIKDVSERLSQDRWYGTQTVAYSLLSVGKFVGDSGTDGKFTFSYAVDGKNINAGSSMPVFNADVAAEGGGHSLDLKNTSKGILYARLILTGRPMEGDSTSAANNLEIAVTYTDSDGKPLDPRSLKQGTDFVAEVSITNPSKTGRRYDEMALTQVFPSGWEITNSRMDAVGGPAGTRPDYQDIRDDRVYTYFDINAGQTQKFVIQLNAAYQGRFYLPPTSCEAMYDNTISARRPGGWVQVFTPKEG